MLTTQMYANKSILYFSKSWQVYKRRALELVESLRQEFEDVDVVINEEKPRRGSFEFTLLKEDGSGITRIY